MSNVEIWDSWNQSGGPKYPHEKIVQYTFRHLKPYVKIGVPFTVLDLGCGGGVHSYFFSREGFNVYGCDISPVSIEQTKKLLSTHNYNSSNCLVCDVTSLPYSNNYFDAVISVGVLDCAGYNSFDSSFSEIIRVLKPGATAILIFASDGDFRLDQNSHLKLHGFTDQELLSLTKRHLSLLNYCNFDKYITTYDNKKSVQKDHLLTLKKK